MNKTTRLKPLAIMLMMLPLAGVMAADPVQGEGDAQKNIMDSAYERAKATQDRMISMRSKLEEMKYKKEYADLISSCVSNGVDCAPEGYSELGIAYIGVNNTPPVTEQYDGGVSVPDITGLGMLQSEPIKPGSKYYDAEYARMNSPQYQQQLTEQQAMQAAQQAQMEEPVDVEEPAEDIVQYAAPVILGIENNTAILSVNGENHRVKAGQYLPGKQWKVRDVSFDNVYLKGPDGVSKRVYFR